MNNSKDDSNQTCSDITINELGYLESMMHEIDDYIEYVEGEEESKVSDTMKGILGDISNHLYKKTQDIRKFKGLPHCQYHGV